MISFPQMTARVLLAAAALLALLPMPVQAQEESGGRNVMIGTGVQWIPTFPGADTSRIAFLPLVDTWRVGAPMTPESPDEAFGFAVLGERNAGLSFGPALTFAPTRSADDLPGMPKVGFGMEAGSSPISGRSSRCACAPNCARALAHTRP